MYHASQKGNKKWGQGKGSGLSNRSELKLLSTFNWIWLNYWKRGNGIKLNQKCTVAVTLYIGRRSEPALTTHSSIFLTTCRLACQSWHQEHNVTSLLAVLVGTSWIAQWLSDSWPRDMSVSKRVVLQGTCMLRPTGCPSEWAVCYCCANYVTCIDQSFVTQWTWIHT